MARRPAPAEEARPVYGHLGARSIVRLPDGAIDLGSDLVWQVREGGYW